MDAIEQSKEDAEARAAKAEAEIARLLALNTELTERADTSVAEAELLASQEKAQELMTKCERLETVIGGLEASMSHQLSELSMKVSSAEDRATAANKELIDVRKAAASQSTELAEAGSTQDDLQAGKKYMEAEIARLLLIEQSKEDAEARAAKAENEVSELQDEMTSYLETAEVAEVEIASLRQQMKETVAPLEMAEAELLASQEKAQELMTKCERLETVIGGLEASMSHQLSELSMKVSSAEDRATAANKELVDVRKAAASQTNSLNKELEMALVQVEELTEALDEAEIIQREERESHEMIPKFTFEDLAKKDLEIDRLADEIDLLKSELNAANDCIEAEMQQQLDQQMQTQAEITELQARLVIAAQELVVQQRSIDQMIEGEKERVSASATDDQDVLMVEMNALLESKIEAETRAVKAESDAKDLKDQLSAYDRNTAEEQEIIMKTAESQMESLRQEREERAQALKLSSAELAETHQKEQILLARCALLEKEVTGWEETVEELESALSAAQQARDTAIAIHQQSETKMAMKILAAEEAVTVVEDAKDAATLALQTSNNDLMSERAAMVEALSIKDQRIAHLEVSKLTQEQMDKIKILKEEHKKSREDVKTMKKQLSQLKKAYDDLKDSSVLGASSADCAALIEAQNTVSVLNIKLQESATRMESTQNIAKALKEKIKDCSKQLQVR